MRSLLSEPKTAIIRIWSLHPKYLDAKGLVALWRETLLAKKVLEGDTKGYRNHSQLLRFRTSEDPLALINLYLSFVLQEAGHRGYRFSQEKVDWDCFRDCSFSIEVPRGQLDYEREHLLSKLKVRDLPRYESLVKELQLELHPVFVLVEGEVEDWEKRGVKF